MVEFCNEIVMRYLGLAVEMQKVDFKDSVI